jgi:hypothetical protein
MCTVGPLLKDESVVFKVRSRLFTQTQIEVRYIRLNELYIFLVVIDITGILDLLLLQVPTLKKIGF